MHKYLPYTASILAIAIILNACGGSGETSELSADDQERSMDWSSQLSLELVLPEVESEFNEVEIVSHQSSKSLDRFVEQVFDMAFTGDAEVFGPTLFGDIDRQRRLDPKSLVSELERFDTVIVEDLMTGEVKDTVVDMSFSKKNVSAVTLHIGIPPGTELAMKYDHLAMGKQVFHAQTGEFRGISDKFFLANGTGPINLENGYIDNLLLFTDSLGAFYPKSFSIHRDLSDRTLGDWLRERFPGETRFQMSLNLGLDSRKGEVIIEAVSIKPMPTASPL